MIIGFTGTRQGLTDPQHYELRNIMRWLRKTGALEFHHGDCVGADAEAHALAIKLGYFITIHPPTFKKYQAYSAGAKTTRYPEPYLKRNRNIVNSSTILIACPYGPEQVRSGTWATVRHARNESRAIIIVWPNGSQEFC